MTSIEKLTISAYAVQFIDYREPEPRQIHTETAVFNAKTLAALDAMGINRTYFIEDQYRREGFKVFSVKKAGSHTASIDLAELYRDAAADDQAKAFARRAEKMEKRLTAQREQIGTAEEAKEVLA